MEADMDQHELAAMHAMAAELLSLAEETGDPEAVSLAREVLRPTVPASESADERALLHHLDLLGVL